MSADGTRDALPDRLADAVAERVFGADPGRIARDVEDLAAANPDHAEAILRFARELDGVASILDETFGKVRAALPETIAGHRVIRVLGEGAFGVVYLCRQEQPVVRDVAVKVLRHGSVDQHTLRRFAAECQVLATLGHPSIISMHDAGVLPDGRPFVVMEYVDGLPLTDHCAGRALGRRDVLALFVRVCRTVAHANARGIVHRDLKPANVLVVEGDDGPLPKIIDFGIAKAVDPKPFGTVLRTDAGRVVGTPGYMSPEQAAGDVERVDARSDVFALGVMLYELLTGVLPWPRGAGATDTDPEPPSRRVTRSSDGVRRTTADRERRGGGLRGDLDWITLRAIARDAEQRYGSVAELASDIERHLRGEPVLAGPPTLRYRLAKVFRRNRARVIAGASVAVAALAIATAVQESARPTRGDPGDADRVVRASRAVVDRLVARANDPELFASGQGDAVRLALSEEAVRVAHELASLVGNAPELSVARTRALLELTRVHFLLGEATAARRVAADAVRLATAHAGADPTDIAASALAGEASLREAAAHVLAGDRAAAIVAYRAAMERLEACAAADPQYGAPLALALTGLGHTLGPDEHATALAFAERATELLEARLTSGGPEGGPEGGTDEQRRQCVEARLVHVRLLESGGDIPAAIEAIEASRSHLDRLPRDHAFRLRAEWLKLRGWLAWAADRRSDAIDHFERSVTEARAWRDAEPRRVLAHRFLVNACSDLGTAQNHLEQFEASSSAHREAIAAADALVAQFPDDPVAHSILCHALREFAARLYDRFRRRDLDEGAACAARAAAVAAAAPEGAPGLAPDWALLALRAGIEDGRGSPERAAAWAAVDAALDRTPDLRAVWSDELVGALTGVARARLGRGDPDGAARRLAMAREPIAALAPTLDKRMVEVAWLEARLAVAAGRTDEAIAAAERIVAARPTWFGRRRAADCMRLAWRATPDDRVSMPYRDRAAGLYRDVAAALVEDVEERPDDPYYVAPWAFAELRLAEIEVSLGLGDAARERAGRALAKLEVVRSDVLADEWDDEAYTIGRALVGTAPR